MRFGLDLWPTQQVEEKDKMIRELQSKLQEVTHTKDRAIRKLKKYHNQRQQLQGGAEEDAQGEDAC